MLKPFDDGSHESPDMLTKADKMQIIALVGTLGVTVLGLACSLTTDRGEVWDTLLSILVAFVGVVPIMMGIYLDNFAAKHEMSAELKLKVVKSNLEEAQNKLADIGKQLSEPVQIPQNSHLSATGLCTKGLITCLSDTR